MNSLDRLVIFCAAGALALVAWDLWHAWHRPPKLRIVPAASEDQDVAQ